ncbi:MAG: ABC transporter permease [Lachnospiraceae bacterium]
MMKQIFLNFKKYRFLLGELVKKDIKLKYRRSYLGVLWTLLEPLLTMMVLAVVFGGFYGKSDHAFPVYILTGRLLYTFFNNGTKGALKSIRSNSGMIKKVYVPKYIYPLSSVISNFVMFLLSLIVLVGVIVYYQVKPTIYLLQAIVPIFLLFVMTLGVGMILSTISVFFRDLEYIWGVATMLIFYASAVFYEPARVVKTGYDWVLDINPLYAAICTFRNAVYGELMDMDKLLYLAIFSFASLVIGLFIFYKKQDDFILNI